jgi:hypothetical protein
MIQRLQSQAKSQLLAGAKTCPLSLTLLSYFSINMIAYPAKIKNDNSKNVTKISLIFL